MWKTWKRWWKYVAMKLRVRQEELADPKVQLMQAMEEARLQHRRAIEQAANVIGNQRVAQQRLEKLAAEHDKLRVTADQALLLAEQQRHHGDGERSARYEEHAEAIVMRVMELEQQLANQEQVALQAGTAADQAKSKVTQNAERLREKLRDSERLLNDLDRAKMYEALNQANRQLDDTLDDDGPTYEGVSRKVDHRLQRAIAAGEVADALQASSADMPAREIDQAVRAVQAKARLDERRAMLGLPVADDPVQLTPVTNDDDAVLEIRPPRRRGGA
jgi:phage shock protein A